MSEDLLDKLLEDSKKTEENSLGSLEEEDEILKPLLNEIGLIQDQNVRSFVRSVLLKVDPTFWTVPSTFSDKDFNPPDEKRSQGNVIHTQRVVRAAELLCEAQERPPNEVDLVLAASILHDVTKCTLSPDGEVLYDPLHPYTVDAIVRDSILEDSHHANNANKSSTLNLDEESMSVILRLIRCHLGTWSPIPETFPITGLDWIVHLADFISSRLHYIVDGPDYPAKRWLYEDDDESDIPEKDIST